MVRGQRSDVVSDKGIGTLVALPVCVKLIHCNPWLATVEADDGSRREVVEAPSTHYIGVDAFGTDRQAFRVLVATNRRIWTSTRSPEYGPAACLLDGVVVDLVQSCPQRSRTLHIGNLGGEKRYAAPDGYHWALLPDGSSSYWIFVDNFDASIHEFEEMLKTRRELHRGTLVPYSVKRSNYLGVYLVPLPAKA